MSQSESYDTRSGPYTSLNKHPNPQISSKYPSSNLTSALTPSLTSWFGQPPTGNNSVNRYRPDISARNASVMDGPALVTAFNQDIPEGIQSTYSLGTSIGSTTPYQMPSGNFSYYRNSIASTVSVSSTDQTSSVRTSMSSNSSIGSMYRMPLQRITLQHGLSIGLWNSRMRVVPCQTDHAKSYFTTICQGCGFSLWHSVCIQAQEQSPKQFYDVLTQLKHGVIPGEMDFAGNSPLSYLAVGAVSQDHFCMFKTAFQQRYKFTCQNSAGQNPLHVLNPINIGEALAPLLRVVKTESSDSLIQRDEDGRHPLHSLLQHPLINSLDQRYLYVEVVEVWDNPKHQLELKDRFKKDTLSLLTKSARSMSCEEDSRDASLLMFAGHDKLLTFMRNNIEKSRPPNAYLRIANGELSDSRLAYPMCSTCKEARHGRTATELVSCA